jgi:general secretion pathway protein G
MTLIRKLTVALVSLIAMGAAGLFAVQRLHDRGCRYDARKVQLAGLELKIEAYQLDTGHLPASLNSLLVSDSPGWNGPYAKAPDRADPWGNPIVYEVINASKRSFTLTIVADKPGSDGGVRAPYVLTSD